MKKYVLRILALVIGSVMLAGCAGTGEVVDIEQRVESSGKPPKIIKEGALYKFDEKSRMHRFVGMVSEANALDIGQDTAESAAFARMTQMAYQEVRNEVTRGITGSEREEVGRFFSSAFSAVSAGVRISGAAARQSYWERYVRDEFGNPRDFYRVWVIVEVSNDDFNRAKAYLLTEIAREAREQNDAQAESLARLAMERLMGTAQ